MEDSKIVELLYIHNEQGLLETKNKYEDLLKYISNNILKNNNDINECINDTYLKIWNTIPPYKPIYYKSFICKIIRQISLDKYRYNHSKIRNELIKDNISYLDIDIKDKKNIDDELKVKELISIINDFLESLDVENRIIFIRKYFLLEDTKVIMKRYELTETNINIKLFRIRKKLKKILESEGYYI